MAKRGIKELAIAVSEKHHLTQKEAEEFVTVLFNVLNDGLHREQMVKIKGLGTFKVIDVKDRESVDVNTGARIMIAGRKKITFTPDAVMKDLVNKPFSQFETVVLNDGVSFGDLKSDDDIITTLEGEMDEEQELSDFQTVSESNNSPLEKDTQNDSSSQKYEEEMDGAAKIEGNQEETDLKLIQEDSKSDHENEEDATSNEKQSENILAPADTSPVDIAKSHKEEGLVIKSTGNETKTEAPNKVLEELSSEKKAIEDDSHECATPHSHHYHHRKESRSRKGIVLGLFLCAVLLIGGFAGGWFAHNQYMNRHSSIQPKKKGLRYAETIPEKPVRVATIKDESIKKQPAKNVNSHTATMKEERKENNFKEQSTQPQTEKGTLSVADLPIQDNNSRMMKNAISSVKTGAYTIVGTQETITVRRGQTLKKISKFYFGEGMECYLMVHNGLTEVKEGQRLKIPKLKMKRLR